MNVLDFVLGIPYRIAGLVIVLLCLVLSIPFIVLPTILGLITKNVTVEEAYSVGKNPSAAIGIAVPIGVAAIRSGQSLIVTHRLKVQNKMASRKIYDASLGTSWDLRRPLTNNDRKAISQMRANGSSLSDALASRKLI